MGIQRWEGPLSRRRPRGGGGSDRVLEGQAGLRDRAWGQRDHHGRGWPAQERSWGSWGQPGRRVRSGVSTGGQSLLAGAGPDEE